MRSIIVSSVVLVLFAGQALTFPISVKSLTGKTVQLSTTMNEEIRSLRQRFAEETGIPAADVRLVFKKRQLLDNWTVKECGIVINSELHMLDIPKPFIQLTLETSDGRKVRTNNREDVTILDLKRKLTNLANIPTHHQIISRGSEVLDDEATLGQLNIRDGSTLRVAIEITDNIQVNVRANQGVGNLTIAVNQMATVKYLKQTIAAEYGIHATRQRFFFADIEMEDKRLLNDYGIEDDSSIDLDIVV